jgi:hypothetical protein
MFIPLKFEVKESNDLIHYTYGSGFKSKEEYDIMRAKFGKCQLETPIKSVG